MPTEKTSPAVNGQIGVEDSDIEKMEELLMVHQRAQLRYSDASMRMLEFLAPHAAGVAETKQAFLKQLDLLREKYQVPGEDKDPDSVWELSKDDAAFVRRTGAELRTEMRNERQAEDDAVAAGQAAIEAEVANAADE